MPLPDISRLSSSTATLRALGRALRRAGVTLDAAKPIVGAALAVPPSHRAPIRFFHLRKLRDAAGYAMRMFMFEDPVTPDEARVALGELVEPLLDVGLLERRAGGVVSPFILSILDDLYVLSDDLSRGQEAVMGFGETTISLCGAAFPRRPIGRALDLGCGSGTAALVLTRCARVVVGTDTNPRAVALARANAALNEVSGLDLREGDLFAPIRGEFFDLIVSQPPFIPKPEGLADASFLYGGRVGDEIALALLKGLVTHLEPKGRALLMVEWPEHGDEPLEQRLRAALGPGANLLILRAPAGDLDAHAAAYAAGLHPGLGEAFDAEALTRREHFERAGIRAIIPTLTVVERSAVDGWTASIDVQPFAGIKLTSERIDKIFAARLIAAGEERLLVSALRVPEGTVLTQEQVGPGAEVPSTLSARFAPAALACNIDMTLEMLGLITLVHEAKTVRAGLERFAELMGLPVEDAKAQALPVVKDALLHGLLEVA